MKTIYKVTRTDWISFEKSSLSSTYVGDRITLFNLESFLVEVHGELLSKDNIHEDAVEAFTDFFSQYKDALRRLT